MKKINPKISLEKYWFAFYTRPQHEFKAALEIEAQGLEYFLPTITTLKRWSDRKKKIKEPLFKSYVFAYVNELERHEILRSKCIVKTITFMGNPAIIPDWEINNLKIMLDSKMSLTVKNSLAIGTRIKVISGPFSGVKGAICMQENNEQMLAVSINLLKRSVVVKLPSDCVINIDE